MISRQNVDEQTKKIAVAFLEAGLDSSYGAEYANVSQDTVESWYGEKHKIEIRRTYNPYSYWRTEPFFGTPYAKKNPFAYEILREAAINDLRVLNMLKRASLHYDDILQVLQQAKLVGPNYLEEFKQIEKEAQERKKELEQAKYFKENLMSIKTYIEQNRLRFSYHYREFKREGLIDVVRENNRIVDVVVTEKGEKLLKKLVDSEIK